MMGENETDPDMTSLDERLKKARAQTVDDRPEKVQVSPMGAAMRLGLELVVGVVIGVIMGRFLDNWLETSPLWLIIFVLLGFAAGVRNVFREAKRMQITEEDDG